MKLRAVGVWNHSRLQDVEVEVRQHLVLVGPNDVGKSSLIRCLDFLLGASTAQLYARLGSTDFRDPEKPLVLQAVLDELDEQDQALFPDEIIVDPATDALSLTLRLEAMIDQNGTLDIRRASPGTGTTGSSPVISSPGWAGR